MNEPSSQAVVPQSGAAAPAPAPRSFLLRWWPVPGKVGKRARWLTASVIWLYLLVNTFVFSIDGYLSSHLPPALSWIISYKFFILLGLTAIILATASTARMISWIIYFIAFPFIQLSKLFIVLFILIIKSKNWTVIFTATDIFASGIRSFRQSFAISAAMIILSVLAFLATSPITLRGTAISLVALALVLVVLRLFSFFKPSQLLPVYASIMALVLKFTQRHMGPDPSMKGVSPGDLNEEQLKKWISSVRLAIIIREFCFYLGRKFIDFRRGGIPVIYYVLNFVVLIFMVCYLLSASNIAIYRCDPKAFLFSRGHGFFDFFYYAFSSMTMQRVSDIAPVSVLARLISMSTMLFSYLFAAMFVTLIFTYKRNIDEEGANSAITALHEQANLVDVFLRTEFSLSVDGAIAELERLQTGIGELLKVLRAAK